MRSNYNYIGEISRITGTIQVRPGDRFFLDRVKFTWTGPARNLSLAFGIKPAGGLDFDNGAHLIDGLWSAIGISVSAGRGIAIDRAIANLGIVTPSPGNYLDRGLVTRTINQGEFTTWVWLTDVDAIGAAGLDVTENSITNEKYILLVTHDDAAGNIIS